MSPVFDTIDGLRFYFYMQDLDEPPHAHVCAGKETDEGDTKIWLEPVAVSRKGNLRPNQLRNALRIAEKNKDAWIRRWNYHERQRR